MPVEGQTATGPNGERAVYRGGQWVVADSAPQRGGGFIPDPYAPGRERRADEDQEFERLRTGITVRGEQRTVADTAFSQAQALRKEFQSQSSVSEYNTALGTYSSSLNTAATAQGDQSLITSYAKMLDPNSAVREGEFATTASTENFVSQIKARLAKEFGWKEGGMLTPQGRASIRGEMRNLILNRFQPAYKRDRQQYERYAQSYGFDPYQVVGEDALSQYDPGLLDSPTAPEDRMGLAEPGAESQARELSPEYRNAHYQYLVDNWGRIDPQDYARFREGLDREEAARSGETFAGNAEAYASGAGAFNEFAANGGRPDQIPGPMGEVEIGAIEGALNTAAQHPAGAAAANWGNAGAMGLPAWLAGGQNELELLREQRPVSSFLGEVGGGITGTLALGAAAGLGSRALGGTGTVAKLLANPVAVDTAYGGAYGAAQDRDNPFRGAAIGIGGGLLGWTLGRTLGKAFPGTFARGASRKADEAVPTIEQLKARATEQYSAAEAAGQVADPDAVGRLHDEIAAILADQSRITPEGRMIDIDSPTSRALHLINDFAGHNMTPGQANSVRRVLGEGRNSQDPDQQRIAGLLVDAFDDWAAPVLPGVEDARKTASRYLQAQDIGEAVKLARSDASQFSQSGMENALRKRFRQLDRSTITGRTRFAPEVEQAIETVAHGTPFSNAARTVGKYAPTSPMAMATGGGALGSMVGGWLGAGAGVATGLGVMGIGKVGRRIATDQAERGAEIAELLARGGPEYAAALDRAAKMAGGRGAHITAGTTIPVDLQIAELLLSDNEPEEELEALAGY